MFQFLKVTPLISGPSLTPLMTVHSAHIRKKNKRRFSVSGRTTKDNVSAPQGLCICSQCDQRTLCEQAVELCEGSQLHSYRNTTHDQNAKFIKIPDNTHRRRSYAAEYTGVLGSCAGAHICKGTQNMLEHLHQKPAHDSDVCIKINIKTTIRT